MKYLRRFNESIGNVVHDCQDILIDLADDGIKYKTSVRYNNNSAPRFGEAPGIITIDISDNVKKVELKKYADNFERLFDYLESLGYELKTTSYYEGDGWDYHERCPSCNSVNGILGKDDTLECTNCGYKDYQGEFTTPEHPLTKGDLMWSVKSGDKPDHIYLEFTI